MAHIKVLQVVEGLGIGGIENMVMNFYRNMNRSKVQFDFYCFLRDGNVYPDEIMDKGGRVFISKKQQINKYSGLFANFRDMYRIMRHGGYRIVHIHSCSLFGMLRAALPARMAGVPCIVCHGHNPGIPGNTAVDCWARLVLKELVGCAANRYFACSKEVAISKYPNRIIKNKRYTLIRNAIDLERFSYNEKIRNTYRIKLGIDYALVLGSVSRLEEQKNHDFMFEVFQEVYRMNPESVLLIVGGGSLEQKLKEKARKMGLEKQVIFYGAVDDAAPFYQAIDIYISTSFYEGLSVSLVEAQTSGCMCMSAPVSEETHVSGRIQIRLLTDDAGKWAEDIVNLKLQDRKSAIEEVKKAGFEIQTEAKRLEDFYLGWET